jgi:cullin 1
MCTQRSPYDWSHELYQRHGQTIERYLTTHVLPALLEKKQNAGAGSTVFLTELQKRWCNHQIMNKWLKRFFTYLDREYVKRCGVPTLLQVGLRCFRTIVYDEMKPVTTAAVLSLINDERSGLIVDKSLIKSIMELYENMGMGTLEAYSADFEQPLLENTRVYYVNKRGEWSDATPDYLIKVENALQDERMRVADYLHSSTESKLLRVVEEELLESFEFSTPFGRFEKINFKDCD